MPRARSQTSEDFQTSAAEQEQGSGCLSTFLLPPLAVVLISCILAVFAFRLPAPVSVQAAAANPISNLVLAATPGAAPLALSTAGLAPFFRPEVLHWSDSIVQWATAANLDPNLAAVVMQIESCGDPRALSRSGAIGLFQVMPFHFAFTDNPYDPNTNALRGLNYLSRSWQAAGGNARLALAGYNGGIGVISRSEWTWPAETQRYVRYGAPIYEDAFQGATQSAALDEWYTKYGVSLCQQASRNQ
jgi:soluble lytic murein transglycosylase-like protein